MKKLTLPLTVIFLCLSNLLQGQVILKQALSERLTEYKMNVELDTETKIVSGDMLLEWRNPSQDTVDNLQFHMYLNAFKNSRSTFSSEGTVNYYHEDEWGYVNIETIQDANGQDLSKDMHYIQPDAAVNFRELRLPDENPIQADDQQHDETVLYVPLNKPVLPDSTVQVKIHFSSKLPKLKTRTGYADNYFFVAQWFPKLAVYETTGMRNAQKGGWNCHQFHSNSEFYADNSLYEVNITLPDDYIVGTGGMLMHEESLPDGKRKLSYRAEDIVDFAWTASQDYVVVEDQWRHVAIRALFQPEHLYQAERHLKALRAALEYFDEHVGPYPWPHVTLIDPPAKGQAAGGMEYTTLFTAGTAYGLPKGLHMPELVTVHEFGHSYFMGMLATNEFEEPWMDEGMNTYMESRIMEHAYGDKRGVMDFPFFHMGDIEFSRLTYVLLPNKMIADGYRSSWEFPHGSYGTVVYQKSATWLNTLERMISQPVMDEVFKRYYKRWAFKHPGTQDFIDIVNEVVKEYYGDRFGESMDWYFDQFLKSDKILDYKVSNISVRSMYQDQGLFGTEGKITFKSKGVPLGMYKSVIGLERLGEAIMPVEILVHFDDGSELTEYWDGIDRARDLIYERPVKVTWAKIDPEMKILMDTNLLNNSYTRNPGKKAGLKYGSKFLFLIQNIMQLVNIFS
ncbi:MAG: M1 family metallopeptidase [Bacteroidales bacterium]|nr:M1 family metallopeptidase [Bacteroidales bacterium]